MVDYCVHVTIQNKPGISDPEGKTILNDLVLKGTHQNVSQINTAQMLKFVINETDKKTAQSTVQKICDELRIYNPMVSVVTIDVFDV
ncbi:MAG TPA: phosphoribosylformylglycinamidine synthase subunit PurS [Nitrosopumilus sp.]|nr:phosphoribosylformylglycinamidine synthase subunit PurS [Thermoproteota archaeon]HJJ24133.1 phosphoribosylformylglycinamidine synthase subunit PurS [Nitrosopumilus sp.]